MRQKALLAHNISDQRRQKFKKKNSKIAFHFILLFIRTLVKSKRFGTIGTMSQDGNSSVGNKVCGILRYLRYHKIVSSPESKAIDYYIFKSLPWSPRNGDSSFRTQFANNILKQKLIADKLLGDKWVYLDLLIRCCIPVFVVKSIGKSIKEFAGVVIASIWKDILDKQVVEFEFPQEAQACLQKWLSVSSYNRIAKEIRDCRARICENLADIIFKRPIGIFQGVSLHPTFYQRSCQTIDGKVPGGAMQLFNLVQENER